MKKLLTIFTLTFAFLAGSIPSAFCGTYTLQNITVKDGDTIKADIMLGFGIRITDSIRIYGIDAPEIHTKNRLEKHAGLLVTEWLKQQILNAKSVQLMTESGNETGKFGRPLGSIIIDGIHLAAKMNSLKICKQYLGKKKISWTNTELQYIIDQLKYLESQ